MKTWLLILTEGGADMDRPGRILFDKTVLECRDPCALADFYARLLGWQKGYVSDGFVIIGSGEGGADIGFQRNEDYARPTWPDVPGEQQMMLHLDFAVPKAALDDWVRFAEACGARLADAQYSDDWRVMVDPEGHPFCLDAT